MCIWVSTKNEKYSPILNIYFVQDQSFKYRFHLYNPRQAKSYYDDWQNDIDDNDDYVDKESLRP